MRHRLDVGPGASVGHGSTQGIAVIGTVSEQDLAIADDVLHVGRDCREIAGRSSVLRTMQLFLVSAGMVLWP